MPIDSISVKDSSGVAKNIAVDDNGSGILVQLFKLMFGTLDTGFTAVDAANPLPVQTSGSSTGTLTSVAASMSSQTLLAANASRRGYTLWNNSTATLYVLNATGTATTSSASVPIGPQEYYEVPFNYKGIVSGIWSAANGAALITEHA